MSDQAIQAVCRRVRNGFKSGKTRSLDWRRQQLERLYKLVTTESDVLVGALQRDLGKPRSEALLADIGTVEHEISECAKKLEEWTKPEKPKVGLINKLDGCLIVPEPLGTILIIAPWNYPVQLTLCSLASAIAAGDAAVVKPSELAENTSRVLAELIPKYLDTECFAVVEGGVPETTALLEERWDHICYTGNPVVARIVMQAAAKHLTPVTLELGGKSPAIIHPSANLTSAARRLAWGKSLNSGQTCIAPDYVLCPREMRERFVGEFKGALEEFYPNGTGQSADYAKMINDRHFNRVKNLMQSGGKVALGGKSDQERRHIEPTVLVDVPPEAPVMQEEIFGPLLPILDCENVEEAIRFINDREKPLALYLFADDKKVADRVIAETSSGAVLVNDTIMHAACMGLPFGGVGNSGMGALHGKYGFDAFSHYKPVMRKGSGLEFVNKLRYPPYSDGKIKKLRKLLFTVPNFKGRSLCLSSSCILHVVFILLLAYFLATFWRK